MIRARASAIRLAACGPAAKRAASRVCIAAASGSGLVEGFDRLRLGRVRAERAQHAGDVGPGHDRDRRGHGERAAAQPPVRVLGSLDRRWFRLAAQPVAEPVGPGVHDLRRRRCLPHEQLVVLGVGFVGCVATTGMEPVSSSAPTRRVVTLDGRRPYASRAVEAPADQPRDRMPRARSYPLVDNVSPSAIERSRPSSAAGVAGTRPTTSGIAATTGPASAATMSSGISSTTSPRMTGTL
jgi:hypothetical protein